MSNVAQAIWARAPRGAREPWTSGRLRERAAAVASRLDAALVGAGDRVLFVAPAVPEFARVCFGILGARVGR